MQDTIYALATGSLGCAVAIVRISGPRSALIAERFFGPGLRPRVASYGRIVDPADGELIDFGLVLLFKSPASFTGEDCVEFQVHGGRAVVARLLGALGREADTRMAEPGEFIRRAFDHDKLSLPAVEGIADLIDARTEAQRRQALAQAGGHLADRAAQWRAALLEALSLIEAEIDFADEGEAPTSVLAEVRRIATSLQVEFSKALAGAEEAERIRSGFRVAIAGPPNAGKSSLLNALVRRDVAIVTEHAGTTRDVIEVELDLGGFSVLLCDTAGIRETKDAVEAIGIERTRTTIQSADLVLWLFEADSAFEPDRPVETSSLVLASKMDKVVTPPAWADMGISASTGFGLDDLLSCLKESSSALVGAEPPLVTNERQKQRVEAASRHLSPLMADDQYALELAAEDIRRSAIELQGLIGRIGTEDVLGSIFSRFCMGK